MLQVVKNGDIQMIVLNKDEEIIITTSNKQTGYVSVYNNGENMVIDGTINKRDYSIPFKERKRIAEERANKVREYNHKRYLESKEKKKESV